MRFINNNSIAAAITAISMLISIPAMSAGTAAGTTVSNSATISYSVGGTAQPDITSAAETFLVDRKINLTVATTDVSAVGVTPGTNGNVLTFTVTNNGNGTQDFALSATAVLSAAAAAFGGNDNVDATSVSVVIESGATGGYQSGEDTGTFIDELAADGTQTVYIVGNFDTSFVNNDIASYHLLAEARLHGAATTLGAVLTETAGADDTGTEDIVFSDIQGSDAANDASRDAQHSDQSDFKIVSAVLSLDKVSVVISDPSNGTTNPKAIPGAVIEYTITVSNAAGAATATGIAVQDSLNTEIATNGTIAFNADTYASGKGIRVTAPNINGGAALDLTNISDGDVGDFNVTTTNAVTVTGIDLAASESATVVFRVTVQ